MRQAILFILFTAIVFNHPNIVNGREPRFIGVKFYKNYSHSRWNSQNWCIIQDLRGDIYIANQGKIWQFNGQQWFPVPGSPKKPRSFALTDEGLVYVCAENDFGFLARMDNGGIRFLSLKKHFPKKYFLTNKTIKIQRVGNKIYAWAPPLISYWDIQLKRLTTIPARDKTNDFRAFFNCRGQLYTRTNKHGLMALSGHNVSLLPEGDFFTDKKIYMIAPFRIPAATIATPNRTLLIGTMNNGLFLYRHGKIVPFKTDVDQFLGKNWLLHGIRLSNGHYALATQKGGLVVIDSDGTLQFRFNTRNGLQDDNIKYIFEDNAGNLWLALEKGIAKIEYAVPAATFSKIQGLRGLVLSVFRNPNMLAAGTTNGLFVMAHGSDRFRAVPRIRSNCWDLDELNGRILAATSGGIFQIRGEQIKKLLDSHANALLCPTPSNGMFWAGTKNGLFLVDSEKSSKLQNPPLNRINSEIHSIAQTGRGDLWLGTHDGVVYNVQNAGSAVSDRSYAPCTVHVYGAEHGLPPKEIYVAFAADRTVFATSEGLYRFNPRNRRFEPDPLLEGKAPVFRLIQDASREIWYHSQNKNYRFSSRKKDRPDFRGSILFRFPLMQINTIYPDPVEQTVWFAGDHGLIRYDPTASLPHFPPPNTVIHQVSVDGAQQDIRGVPDVPRFKSPKQIVFNVATPVYQAEERTRYAFLLEGYDRNWSRWQPGGSQSYYNLGSGTYTFRARARDVFGRVGSEARYSFYIPPPWYLTSWAIIIYVLFLFFFVGLTVKLRSRQLLKEQQRLQAIIDDRTREINEKNRQLEELDHAKSRFFANISHEFRTPLTLIQGPLERMLADPGKSEAEKKEIRVMTRNSRRLLVLVNQLLELAKSDSGKMILRVQHHDIISFLKEMTASFRLLAGKFQQTIAFESQYPKIHLYFDPQKMEEAVGNLLLNAVKYTPPRGRITVSVEKGDCVRVSVQDSGPGIPHEQVRYIFDRFFRVTAENRGGPEPGGTGIGLALAKEIITLHHGTIQVHTASGEGTRFDIHLQEGRTHFTDSQVEDTSAAVTIGIPYQPGETMVKYFHDDFEDDHNRDKNSRERHHSDSHGDKKNIVLVVEDNPDVRAFIRRAISPAYRVEEAADGGEGIDRALELIPDIIVSDIMMPRKDGFQLCHTLKNDIKTSHIPIILLTARASDQSVVKGYQTGADDYITKPFNTEILLARIKNLIDLRNQLQEKIQRQLRLEPDAITVPSIDETFMNELKKTVETHLSNPDFNVEMLSRIMSLSRNTLYRKIMGLTGEPPNQFIRSYRLKRAARLLEANFGNVTEVAMETGFSSTAYFTRCFKEKFHRVPTDFQESRKI